MSVVVDTQYTEVELGDSGEGRSAALDRTPSKVKRQDLRWSKVNFRVGEKKILQDCWGHVVCVQLPSSSSLRCLKSIFVDSPTASCWRSWGHRGPASRAFSMSLQAALPRLQLEILKSRCGAVSLLIGISLTLLPTHYYIQFAGTH